MRRIDSMSSDELEVLKLKGMLPERDLDRRIDDHIADESDSFADSYYNLRDEGRNPNGDGESYAERNL